MSVPPVDKKLEIIRTLFINLTNSELQKLVTSHLDEATFHILQEFENEWLEYIKTPRLTYPSGFEPDLKQVKDIVSELDKMVRTLQHHSLRREIKNIIKERTSRPVKKILKAAKARLQKGIASAVRKQTAFPFPVEHLAISPIQPNIEGDIVVLVKYQPVQKEWLLLHIPKSVVTAADQKFLNTWAYQLENNIKNNIFIAYCVTLLYLVYNAPIDRAATTHIRSHGLVPYSVKSTGELDTVSSIAKTYIEDNKLKGGSWSNYVVRSSDVLTNTNVYIFAYKQLDKTLPETPPQSPMRSIKSHPDTPSQCQDRVSKNNPITKESLVEQAFTASVYPGKSKSYYRRLSKQELCQAIAEKK